MAHDVFISHSTGDKTTADAVCAILESAGLRCWVAPRDIRPGETWAGSIFKAVSGSRAMVIILSKLANTSKHVMREVELAVKHDVVIVPFRTEDVEPAEDLGYFLSSTHWLDAVTPPLESRIHELAACLRNLVMGSPPPTAPDTQSASRGDAADVPETVRAEGVPVDGSHAADVKVALGDDLAAIKEKLGLARDPDRYAATTPGGTVAQYWLREAGLFVFFDASLRVSGLRFEAPYRGVVEGVRIGQESSEVLEVKGKPAKEFSGPPGITCWLFPLGENQRLRCDIDSEDMKVRRIFCFASGSS